MAAIFLSIVLFCAGFGIGVIFGFYFYLRKRKKEIADRLATASAIEAAKARQYKNKEEAKVNKVRRVKKSDKTE